MNTTDVFYSNGNITIFRSISGKFGARNSPHYVQQFVQRASADAL
jgi:hypothetical protein